jgi:hypothetical protein
MGLMGGIFAPDDYAKWPKLDRTNPDYLIDLNPKGRMGAVAAGRPVIDTRETAGEEMKPPSHK